MHQQHEMQKNNMTKPTKLDDIKRQWHLVDLKGKVLGRTATEIAKYLMGKSKPYFVTNLDCGDYVVVTNASSVVTTGKKEKQKKYYRHSGYPGGFREETLEKLKVRKPDEVVRHAIFGMLPDNKLRDKMLRRLYIYAGEEHPYGDKLKVKN